MSDEIVVAWKPCGPTGDNESCACGCMHDLEHCGRPNKDPQHICRYPAYLRWQEYRRRNGLDPIT